jgi:hypothetical protein
MALAGREIPPAVYEAIEQDQSDWSELLAVLKERVLQSLYRDFPMVFRDPLKAGAGDGSDEVNPFQEWAWQREFWIRWHREWASYWLSRAGL